MNAADSANQREQLPDLDALDVQSLKALVLAKQAELDSRTTEIESLKLLILKLKRMHFGPSSEKYDHDIQQLELRLEDLETNQAAAERPVAATVAVNQSAPRKPARRPLPAALPRETETIAPKQEACPDCGGKLRSLGEDVSETLEYVPARFKVIRTVRPKLSCAGCSRIVQAPAPDIAAAGRCAEKVCAERGKTARRRCAGPRAGAGQRENQNGALVDLRS